MSELPKSFSQISVILRNRELIHFDKAFKRRKSVADLNTNVVWNLKIENPFLVENNKIGGLIKNVTW